jgi:hypothetical protein
MAAEQVQDILTVQQEQDRLLKLDHMSITGFVAAVVEVVAAQKANGQVREKVFRVLD